MSRQRNQNGDRRPVRLLYIRPVGFHDARFLGADDTRRESSLVISIKEGKRNSVENLSFEPLDAMRMVEATAMALRRSGCEVAERASLLMWSSQAVASLPTDPLLFATAETLVSADGTDRCRHESGEVTAPRAVFLHILRGVTPDAFARPFIILSLARGGGQIEQFALEPHDALMLADSLVRNLVKFGSHGAKSILAEMKEGGIR